MPGVVMDETFEGRENYEVKEIRSYAVHIDNSVSNGSPRTKDIDIAASQTAQKVDTVYMTNGVAEPSIEELYENVCEMQSSEHSPSRLSYGSDGDESRIDSELRHLVGGGEMREVEIMEEDEEVGRLEHDHDDGDDSLSDYTSRMGGASAAKLDNSESATSKSPPSGKLKKGTAKLTPIGKIPSVDQQGERRKQDSEVAPLSKQKVSSVTRGLRARNVKEDKPDSRLEDPNLGPFLLKQARDVFSSGDNPHRALDLALRAGKAFERCVDGKPSLDMVMCLHVTAAIYCNLGRYADAIPVLERSIEIPVVNEEGQNHALAKFAGYMQLGDTHAMLGQLEKSILCYRTGLGIQIQALGDKDPAVRETCRYLAEAHVQALQFDEAKELCQMALNMHKGDGLPSSLEEAADRRLMALICESKGDHETALEHLVLASMAMVAANGPEADVASVDCSIGEAYLSLNRYDEASCAYEKALAALKSSKGETHPSVASVFVRLADLCNRTGKLRESKSYCENALRIYGKSLPGVAPEEIASGLTDVSAIYESMNELENAVKLLDKALKIYDSPGQQSTTAGIEAQMGVIYYMLGRYADSYDSFKSSISKLRASGEKKSVFFGIALNQMGLACVQRYAIHEALDLFEEARAILEQECGPHHPVTLGVCSNLAGTYDAVGRLDDAIEILEFIVGIREEKLGTANPEVDDEKKRLGELLKEAGRARNRKARSLENLLGVDHHCPNTATNNNGIKV
ncbi:unnamed protein product [Cuscuta campestris]|uniref:Uncharacterized protein n=1 Tax=Cuscuta campestris TaxID=132261 RepID=A0A484LFA6_9ASTE|nr:unnamed protein product [Cuscuta campestris]